MTEDRIERSVHVAASPERVWEVLTTPEYIGRWFGDGTPATVDLRPDGVMVLEPMQGERYLASIVTVEAPRYFAYRWAAAHPLILADESNSTLVEFHLAADGEGTNLTVCESGFATLAVPAGREQFAGYESHSNGWSEVIGNIRGVAEKVAA